MRIGALKTIVREELAKYGELPKWIEPFLQTINQFIGPVGQALKGNLTFEDNFLCVVKQLTFTSGSEQAINPASNLRVSGVFWIDTNGVAVDKFNWSRKSDGTIGVTFTFDGASEAICKVIILLG